MTQSARQVTLAILFSLVMIGSMMGPFVGGAVAAADGSYSPSESAIQPTGQPVQSDIGTINITDDLAVWERAPLRPIKIDRTTGPDSPATTVDSPEVTLEGVNIETSQEAIFEQDDDVSFNLDGTSDLPEEELRVLVTRIDANQDTTEVFLNAQNVSVEEVENAFEDVEEYSEFESTVQSQNEVRFGTVRDFFNETSRFETFADSFAENQTLTTERFEEALTSEEFLDLTEFSTVSAGEIRADGTQEATVNLDQAGTYILIGHIGGNVYDEGDRRPRFNDTTALGVDAVTAQEASSTIELDSNEVEAGNNVSITATADLDTDANISHAVAVLDEETFSGSETEILVDGGFSRDVRAEDVTVSSEISEIQGVANVQPNIEISGTDIASDEFSGTVSTEDQADSFFDIRNALVDGFNIRDQAGDAATFNTIGDTTLNASMTAIGDATSQESIEVETLEEWESGTYTVLHIASDQEDGNISTNRDTIEIVDDIDTGGGGTGGGDNGGDDDGGDGGDDDGGDGGGDDDNTVDDEPPEVVEPAPEDLTIVEREGGAAVSVRNIRANTPTRFGVGRNVSRNGASVRNFTVNLAQDRDEFSVNVSTSDDPPETAPPVETGTSFTYVDVDAGNLTDDDYNSVEWDFSVDLERLEENDLDPEDVQLQRYNETQGAWERFETTHRGDGEFVAEVPGFSTFAITAVEPASLSVTDASLSADEVQVDETFDVAATVENTGDESGETELEVLVDGDVVETRTVTLDGDETAEETFEVSVAEAGDFEVTVNAVSAGDVSVVSADTGDGDGTGEGDGDGQDDGGNLGLALVLVLFALLIVGGFIYYLNVQE